jgi:hypothetical protein
MCETVVGVCGFWERVELTFSRNESSILSETVDRKSVLVPEAMESRADMMAVGNIICDWYDLEGVVKGELLDSRVVVL